MPYKFRFEEACTNCGQPTHEACDQCSKPFCGGGACLFLTGKMLTFPPDPRDEYPQEWSRPEEMCMQCFKEIMKRSPVVIWQVTSMESALLPGGIRKGSLIPAGDDMHSWYSPPSAERALLLRWGDQKVPLDTFRVLQLLEFLKANEQMLREQAKKLSDILVEHERKMTDAAIRADAGIIDYSQYE